MQEHPAPDALSVCWKHGCGRHRGTRWRGHGAGALPRIEDDTIVTAIGCE